MDTHSRNYKAKKRSKPNRLRIKQRLPLGLGTRTHKDQRKESSRTACRKSKALEAPPGN